ncbi:enoylCoA hydratase/isomerase family putative [Martensiomyces pterosporus]|nr:enoylCoA hydratase/isomerase family putative [Martensiomyces pterosporus]
MLRSLFTTPSVRIGHQLRSNIAHANNTAQLFRFVSTTTASTEEITLTRHTGADKGIVTLTLNRPKAKNALSRSLVSSFRSALEDIRFDREARVVILRSAVPGVFCAGADLKERATMSPVEVEQFLHSMKTAFKELENLPQPTIAALDGAALGGGFELSLCCDLRVAGPRALLGLPETSLAIIPGAGGTLRLTKLIGPSQTKALVFTARRLGPYPALSMGIVNDVVEPAECMDEQSAGDHGLGYERALEWAREILPNGPIAVRMAKRSIDHANSVDPATGLDVEQLCYAQVIPTEDRLEGLRAFKEKRKPVYKGC